MTDIQSITNFIGIASKAKKIVIGEDLIVDAMRKNKIDLLFMASDIGASQESKLLGKCHFYNVPCTRVLDRIQISKALGKKNRVMVGIKDEGIANAIKKLL